MISGETILALLTVLTIIVILFFLFKKNNLMRYLPPMYNSGTITGNITENLDRYKKGDDDQVDISFIETINTASMPNYREKELRYEDIQRSLVKAPPIRPFNIV